MNNLTFLILFLIYASCINSLSLRQKHENSFNTNVTTDVNVQLKNIETIKDETFNKNFAALKDKIRLYIKRGQISFASEHQPSNVTKSLNKLYKGRKNSLESVVNHDKTFAKKFNSLDTKVTTDALKYIEKNHLMKETNNSKVILELASGY